MKKLNIRGHIFSDTIVKPRLTEIHKTWEFLEKKKYIFILGGVRKYSSGESYSVRIIFLRRKIFAEQVGSNRLENLHKLTRKGNQVCVTGKVKPQHFLVELEKESVPLT